MKIQLEYRGNLISGNHRNKMTRTGKVYPSKEYKEFKNAFLNKLIVNADNGMKSAYLYFYGLKNGFFNNEKLKVLITIFHNRMDLDGSLKCIFDSLQGIAYKNDNQIKKIEAEIVKHKTIVGFDIIIEEIL